MKVYRIWNETKQRWEESSKGRSLWNRLCDAKGMYTRLKKYHENYRYSTRSYYPDYLIIKEFELCNEKEIV